MASKSFGRIALLASAFALLAALVSAPGATATVYSFKPERATHGAVLFEIRGVRPATVRTAQLRIPHHRSVTIGRGEVKRAARRGRLRLGLAQMIARARQAAEGRDGTSASPSAEPTATIASRSSRLKIVADTTAPETTITSGPSGPTSSRSASFGFTSSERHSAFQCRRDSDEWSQCNSPQPYSEIAPGTHTFYVRAYDRAGNVDPTPATRSWTVEAPQPVETEPSPAPEPLPAGDIMYDGFQSANGPHDLITNEYTAWHSWDTSAVSSPVWQSDGGSLFSVPTVGPDGNPTNAAYTGELDSNAADKYSESNTHSNKMRFWTKASGFADVTVEADIKATSWSPEAPSSWGGFKFYLRREQGVTDSPFYTAEPYIKDGHLYIQKKCLGDTGGGNFVPGEGSSPGGTYYILASKTGYTPPLGSWHKIGATVQTNADGSVTISLYRDGVQLLQGVDRGVRSDGTGCAPLYEGHLGFRSDFLQYYLDDFAVSPQP